MLRRLLLVALLAGLVGGAVATLAQAVAVWPSIERAEAIEAAQAKTRPAAGDHAHGPSIEATWLTGLLANIVVALGFALLLCACWLVLASRGGLARGLLWGLGGFLAFAVAPALKLPPLPPGVDAGALLARQLIWAGTGLATAIGLMLLLLARRWWLRPTGLILIALPHALGGPLPLPPMAEELASLRLNYVAGLIGASALFWLALGATTGMAWRRLGPR